MRKKFKCFTTKTNAKEINAENEGQKPIREMEKNSKMTEVSSSL